MLVNLGYLYLCQWLIISVLSLARFEASGFYLHVYVMTLISVLSTTLSFSLVAGLKRSPLSPPRLIAQTTLPSSMLDSSIFLIVISFLYLLLILVEAFIAGGFPMLALFGIGRQMTYVDFGIPGIHGIVNCIGYVVSLVSFYQFLGKSNWARPVVYPLFAFVGVYFIFVLQLHRAVIMASLIQSLALLFLFRRRTLSALWLATLASTSAILFGFLGDLRSGREHFLSLAGLQTYPNFLPTGFAWIYVYVTTPFLNTLSNSRYLVSLQHTYLPFETLQSSIPSFFRPPSQIDLGLDSEAWNVHSFFSPLLADFGYFAFLPSVLIGFMWALCFNYAKRDQRFWPLYSVAFMQVLLTCFGSLSFHISFLFEMLILVVAALFRAEHSSAPSQ